MFWSVAVLLIISAENLTAEKCDFLPKIVELREKDTWNLEVRWTTDEKQCRKFQVYEIQIGRNENFTVVYQKNVSDEATKAGVPFYTVWTSALPLQCADHSARVRGVFNSSLASSWSKWATNYGQRRSGSSHILLFPVQKVLREGASAMFCCVPGDGANVTSMRLGNMPYPVHGVDQHVQAISTARLNSTLFGLNLICQDDSGSERKVLNYVTFPPERPQDLSCETSDLQRIICSWKSGRKPNLSGVYRRIYTLRFQGSGGADRADVPCDVAYSRCTFNIVPEQSFYNISVVVRNDLGEEKQNYAFNIFDRVFPVAGDIYVAAGVTDADVSWAVSGNFTGLKFSCWITLESARGQREVQVVVREWEQRLSVRLQRLQPSCQYSVTLCCGLQGKSYGPTATPTHFSTDPLVTLDVWRKLEGAGHNRRVTVLWKTLNSDSHSSVQVFEVCVEQKDSHRRECENVTQTQADLPVGPGLCHVTVRAVIHTGLSVPAHITVPAFDTVPVLEEKRIMGNADGFLLSWSSVSSATYGYIVEWCMMGSVLLQWSKVAANQTSLFLPAGGFRKGWRYKFRIFSCHHTEGDRLHEKQTGYLEEQKPHHAPELHNFLSVSWSSVKLEWSFNEENPTHPGFITGYMITVHHDSLWNSTHSVWSISVDRPDCKTLEVTDLQENQQYRFWLAACTRAGCGPYTIYTITTMQNSYLLLVKVLTPLLVLIGCFICLWPCRKTLAGIAGDVFSFPSDHTLKVLTLDGNLYEVSEMIRTLHVEECRCCDLEFVEAPRSVGEKSHLLLADCANREKNLPMPAAPPLTEPSPTHIPAQWGWAAVEDMPRGGETAGEAVTSVMNLSYLPCPQFPEAPGGAPEPQDHASMDTGPCRSGYVTTVTTVTMTQDDLSLGVCVKT